MTGPLPKECGHLECSEPAAWRPVVRVTNQFGAERFYRFVLDVCDGHRISPEAMFADPEAKRAAAILPEESIKIDWVTPEEWQRAPRL